MFESVLVDTSAAILLFNGSKSATQAFNKANAVYVPSLVYGELFLGMEGASNRELEEKKIKEFQQRSQLLSIDYATSVRESLNEVEMGSRKAAGSAKILFLEISMFLNLLLSTLRLLRLVATCPA